MKKIKVVDAPCGAGKTSWAIQYINENPEKAFIYCTPFLDEIDRIVDACGNGKRFKQPQPWGKSKIESFNDLLCDGKDIAVTHTTFLNATEETMANIKDGSYTLIIDEALDVVSDFNTVQGVERQPKQKMTKDDISFLLDNGIISIGAENEVKWIGGEYNKFKFSEVQRLANLNRLYCIDKKFLLTTFPPEIFGCFEDVYVLTYLFDGTIFKYYADYFEFEIEKKSVGKEGGNYYLEPYSIDADMQFRRRCKKLITVWQNKRMNDYDRKMLSSKWFSKAKPNDFDTLKKNIYNFYKYCIPEASAKHGDIMWTCKAGDEVDSKKYYKKLKGRGYTSVRALTRDDEFDEKGEKLSRRAFEELKKTLDCFVPCNAKATNIYKERWALAYCLNMNVNPEIEKFFLARNEDRKSRGMSEISFDRNLFSLECMLQWIFRSRIRDDKPITIYIPSTRMRGILNDWLSCSDLFLQGGVGEAPLKRAG